MAILLTTNYQLISTIILSYGEVRTYARYLSQDKSTNVTTYNIKTMYYTSQNTLSFSSATATVDGESKNYGYTTFYKGETTLQDVNRTITHNADGSSPTKNIATSWTASYGGSGNTSADVYFPKIDRYPMLTSAPNFNDEANPTITYTTTMGFSNATLSACISLNGQADTISYRTINVIDGNYTFELTNVERTTLRQASSNLKSLPVTFILKTTANNTNYFSKMSAIMSIVNAEPTFATTITETNQDVIDILDSSSATNLIKNVSQAEITVTPTAYKEATISGVIINNTTITSSPYQTTIIPTSGNFNINVIDSRGYQTAGIETRNLINYEKIKINSFSFKRENPTSSNIIVNLDCVYYSLSNNNLNNPVTVQYKLDNGNFATIPSSNYVIDNTNHKLTITNYEISNILSYTNQGEFTIKISDSLSETSDKIIVIKGIPTMDLGEHDLQVNGDLYIADTDRENEFKIYNNFEYSTTEKVVGKWVDGKPLYRKVYYVSAFPNNTTTNFAHNLSNADFVKLDGIATDGTSLWLNPNAGSSSGRMTITANATNVFLYANSNRSSLHGYVILEYTKTTD